MAKHLLLKVLKTKFGTIFNGLDEEHLQVAVWSGNVVLEGLTIKKEALDAFTLPLCIKTGSIRRMNINVPWTRLGSQPIKVEIEGVNSALQLHAVWPASRLFNKCVVSPCSVVPLC